MIHNPEFWVAIAFVIAVSIALWKGVPAVTSILDERARRIRLEIEEAQRLRGEAQAMLADYQKKQREALAEAAEIVARAQADAERIGAEAAAQLELQLQRREHQAAQRIDQAQAQALAEVRGIAVEVAIQATRRLIVETMDPASASAMIDRTIEELPAQLH